MIRRSLEAIKDDIQSFLDLKDPDKLRPVTVVLSNLLNQEGKLEFKENSGSDSSPHMLVMTLVNIEQENHLKPPHQVKALPGGLEARMNPPENINVYVLFTAYSSHYETSLSLISELIGFFQTKSFFDRKNTPALHQNIKRITADLHGLTFEQLNYLWGLMGAKYMPSVLYKLRTLTIDEEAVTQIGKPVQEINFSGAE